MKTRIEKTIPLTKDIASTATLKLASMQSLDPFYTPLEERFERITRLACRSLRVPAAAITIVQHDRQWFKSVVGWQVTELPLAKSLCNEVIKKGEQVIINDTLNDLSLMSNPFVCHGPKFRFYAGCAIKDSVGDTIGSFCVMDVKPRVTDAQFGTVLADLGFLAQREIFSSQLEIAQVSLATKLGESRRQAMFDSLTRVWNRRGGTDLLNAAMLESDKYDHTLGLCVADIDNFKEINDQFGHPIGDQVLRKVAAAIVATVRPQDVVSRFGGDEFMFVVRDVNPRTCFSLADRVCKNIHDLPIRTRKASISITISVGIALRDKGDVISTEHLLERADEALYVSKNRGRNCVSFAPAQKLKQVRRSPIG